MSVQPSDFFIVADNCLQEGSEISLRSAVSRAYYGAYHYVSNKLKGDIPDYPCGDHEKVVRYLKSQIASNQEDHDPQTMKRLSYMLTQLKTERRIADYELDKSIHEATTKNSVCLAKKILEMI